jgi:signal transduction histidine kinase
MRDRPSRFGLTNVRQYLLRAGSGLIGLADRLDVLGGTLTLESQVGTGTRVIATIPFIKPRNWPTKSRPDIHLKIKLRHLS